MLDYEGLEILEECKRKWENDEMKGEEINFIYLSETIQKVIDPPTKENYVSLLDTFVKENSRKLICQLCNKTKFGSSLFVIENVVSGVTKYTFLTRKPFRTN